MAADRILDLAWDHIDRHSRGYLPQLEWPLLIESINTYLKSPLLNDEELQIFQKLAEKQRHQRMYKSEFKTLFNSLIGISFTNAVQLAQVDNRILEQEGNAMNKKDDPMLPSFKKEWRQYKRLSESQEDEIQYREDMIRNLESTEKKERLKTKGLTQKLKDLERAEQEVVFRDKIIVERDLTIGEKDSKIMQLQKRIQELNEEIGILKTSKGSEIARLEWAKQDKFHQDLREKVQRQQEAIAVLKQNLTNSKTPSYISKPISEVKDVRFQTEFSGLNYNLLWIPLLMLILWYFLSSDEPWYANTPLEPFFFEMMENADIDYAYYE